MKYYRSMAWIDDFKADLLLLVQKTKPEAVEVTDWDESIETGGYCESCSYEEISVDVYYQCNAEGCRRCPTLGGHIYSYNGNFAELMKGLANGWL
jgi:hypothetical protein